MESTQERIVAVARKLFAENGFHGTTTSAIAREAGVAEGTIYRYFKDKKDLFIVCVEPAIQEAIRRETSVTHDGTPRGMLRSRIIERVRVVREHMDIFSILIREGKSHPELAQMLVQQILSSVPEHEFALIRQATDSGLLRRPLNPLIMNVGLTAAIWAMLSLGPAAEQIFAGWPGRVQFDSLEEDLAEFVCDALLKQDPGPLTRGDGHA